MVPQDNDMQARPVSQRVRCSRHDLECVQGFNRDPPDGAKAGPNSSPIAVSIYTLDAMEGVRGLP